MFVRFTHVLLTTELRSFSGNGSCTSERGSSGFFSLTLGKTFDCTKELQIQKTILKLTKYTLTKLTAKSNNKRSSNIKSKHSKSQTINTRRVLEVLKAGKMQELLMKSTNPHTRRKTYMRTEGSLLWRLRWYETATNSPQNTEKSTGICCGSQESWKQAYYTVEYSVCLTQNNPTSIQIQLKSRKNSKQVIHYL